MTLGNPETVMDRPWQRRWLVHIDRRERFLLTPLCYFWHGGGCWTFCLLHRSVWQPGQIAWFVCLHREFGLS